MKIIILSILFLFTANAQNVWYVDRDSLGHPRTDLSQCDGTSWATAWTDFDENDVWGYNHAYGIDWEGLISAGDTIYISGGSDSTTYRVRHRATDGAISVGGITIGSQFAEGTQADFDVNNPVIIAPAWHAGHNGDVYIVNDHAEVTKVFTINYMSGIKFVNINFVSSVPVDGQDDTEANGASILGHDNTFENCVFQNNGAGSSLSVGGYSNNFINCTIHALYNEEARSGDIFTMTADGSISYQGGHKFIGCTFWQRNNYGGFWNNGANMTVTDTSLTDTDLTMPIDAHAQATVWAGINDRWYLTDLDSSNSNTFYEGGGWIFTGIGLTDSVQSLTVTVTDTSLTDINKNWQINEFVNAIITCNGKTMTITSNTATTYVGTGWSGGGNPGNAHSYSIAGGTKPPDGLDWYVNTTAHKDLAQILYSGAIAMLETVFDKCKFFNITPNSMRWNQNFYITGFGAADTSAFLFTNNLMVLEFYDSVNTQVPESYGGAVTAISSTVSGSPAAENSIRSFRFYNNTFIAPGSTTFLLVADTVIMKNNIFINYITKDPDHYPYETSPAIAIGVSDARMQSAYIDMDYNLHYRRSWLYDNSPESYKSITSGNNGYTSDYTWGEWQNAYTERANWIATDQNSDTSYISMVDVIDSVATSYIPPDTLIGTDLSSLGISYLDEDLLGNTRGSTWYLGAIQYDAGAVDSLPNSFSFTDISNATRNTLYTSNAVMLAGFDSAYAYAGGAEYTVYNVGDIPPYTYITGYTRVFPDDIIRVRQMSSGSYSTPVNVTLTVGSGSDIYTVTTMADPGSSTTGKVMRGSDGKILKDSTGRPVKSP